MGRRLQRRMVLLVLLPLLAGAGFWLCPGAPALVAHAAPAPKLTVRVGYLGTEYVEVKSFTGKEFRALGMVDQLFTYVDAMPAPVLQATRGVMLRDILVAAGVDPGSVQRYDFRAADGHKPYQEFTSLGLLGTTRYYYPNLVPSWNAQKRAPGFAADVDAEPVTTIIAAEQSWERYGETPRWDDMDSEWGYQLCFGMASVNDPLGAHDSVHDILSIDCLLAGSPPEGFGENEKKDKIGSKPENSSQSAKDNKGQSAKDNKGKNANGQEGISAGESSSPAITVPKSNVLEILDKPAQDSLKGTQLLQSGAVEIQGAAGAALQGDIPWEVFEISPQSTPLLLPPLDPKALALVLGALTLSFLLGCAAGFTRLF